MVFSELDAAIAVIANPINNLRVVELGVLGSMVPDGRCMRLSANIWWVLD
jgi:hypothetical protein